MKFTQLTFALATLFISAGVAAGQGAKDYPIKPVPFTNVHIKDSFWSQRLEINRTVTLPHNFKECEVTGRVDNFAKAAGLKSGRYRSDG